MKVRIKWVENVTFVAETESSHAIVMDGAPEGGGRNLGPRPMETMLAGTGGCTAYDVVTILSKARQNISDCVVEVDAERAAQEPKVFTRIHFHFIVTGRDVDARQVIARSTCQRKSIARRPSCWPRPPQITHDFEIRESEGLGLGLGLGLAKG